MDGARDGCEVNTMFTVIAADGVAMKFNFTFTVDLPIVGRGEFEREWAEVQRELPGLARAMVQLRRAHRELNRDQLVQLFIGDVTPTPVDIDRARLEAQAWRQILLSGEGWLTAAQVGELANLGAGNPVATVNRWKKDRKIFAITRDGRDYYPRYALGADFRLRPAVAAVLKILSWQSGERLAAWFESTSSFLGGKRPREVLASDPASVARAAHDAVEAESFAG